MASHHCPSFPCPICYPSYSYPPHYLTYPSYPGFYSAPAPRGCVCPAGAELTCQGFGCPRKGIGGGGVTCSASGIEAATAGETTKIGSTEGESPTAESGDAKND